MAWAHAVRSTHLPIGTIRPVSSAMGMNVAGGTVPSCGMVPAQQRLDAVDAAGAQVELGLVVQRHLARARWRGAGRSRGVRRSSEMAVERFVEELEVVLALLLRVVHRGIGVLEQQVVVGAVGRVERRADAGGDPAFVAHQLEGLQRGRQQLARDGGRPGPHRLTSCSSTTNSSPPRRATASLARSASRNAPRDLLEQVVARARAPGCR